MAKKKKKKKKKNAYYHKIFYKFPSSRKSILCVFKSFQCINNPQKSILKVRIKTLDVRSIFFLLEWVMEDRTFMSRKHPGNS